MGRTGAVQRVREFTSWPATWSGASQSRSENAGAESIGDSPGRCREVPERLKQTGPMSPVARQGDSYISGPTRPIRMA